MSRTPPPTDRRPDDGTIDDTGCTVLHVDMDAFFASVEVRRRPELRGTPVIVGGDGTRGVVTSATYEARVYGVHSAMPMSRAVRLCPQATVIPGDHAEYAVVSRAVMAIFDRFTPLVQPLSLDEAFLDVSRATRLLGPPRRIAQQIRATVAAEQGITCSVGVAPTMFVAKIASTRSKPDGLLVVPRDGVLAFLHPLPVSALWGVGPRTGERLRSLGIETIGDLGRARPQTLRSNLGPAAAQHLAALARNHDPRSVEPTRTDKSIGAEETFWVDTEDPMEIRRELLRLSQKVGSRLRAAGLHSRTVSIKVRFADFTTISRAQTLPRPTDLSRDLYATAVGLYDEVLRTEGDRLSLRLVGVRAENLAAPDGSAQQLLLGEPETGWTEAERVVDEVTRKYGRDSVRPAALLARPAEQSGRSHRAATGSLPASRPAPADPRE